MRWFRSRRYGIAWVACFALACQLVLSFGHIHLGKLGATPSSVSLLSGHDTAAGSPSPAPTKQPTGLADDYCAICSSIRLANALITPIAPTLELPHFVDQPLKWSATQARPPEFEHFPFQARGP